jgi:hypothetical protein
MRPVRALPTPLMSRGQLPHLSCRPASGWPALKERAAALRGGSPHRASCRRTPGPRTKIRLGAPAHAPSTPATRIPSGGGRDALTRDLCPRCPILQRPLPASRSFVLALLRALHLDPGRGPSCITSNKDRDPVPTSFTRTLIDRGSPYR